MNRFVQFLVTTTDGTSTIKAGQQHVFPHGTKPGSDVRGRSTAFSWTIASVGNSKYRCVTLLTQ